MSAWAAAASSMRKKSTWSLVRGPMTAIKGDRRKPGRWLRVVHMSELVCTKSPQQKSLMVTPRLLVSCAGHLMTECFIVFAIASLHLSSRTMWIELSTKRERTFTPIPSSGFVVSRRVAVALGHRRPVETGSSGLDGTERVRNSEVGPEQCRCMTARARLRQLRPSRCRN